MKNLKIFNNNLKNHLSNFENLRSNNELKNKIFKAIDLIKVSIKMVEKYFYR